MLASLDGQLLLVLALRALHPENDFLGSLCLLPEDGFSLSSKTLLLTVVSPSPLRKLRFLSLLVLGYFVDCVFQTLSSTVGFPRLGYVDHLD